MPRETRPADGRDDGRHRRTHRILGLPIPPTQTEALRGDGSGEPSDRTAYEYGKPVHGLAGLLQVSRDIAADPALALTERFRFAGATYFWNTLHYPPTEDGFQRAVHVSRSAFDRRGTAFYLEGVVAYRVYPTRDGKQLHLKLCYSLPATRPSVQVLMPNRDEFMHAVGRLRQGNRVAVFSSEIWKPDSGDAGLVIEQPDQVLQF